MIEITKELHQFRSGLIALIPLMEEAGIGWKDQEQYDSFDTIADALFSAFVVDSLKECLDPNNVGSYKYDFFPHTFSNGREIIIRHSNQTGKFIRLKTCQSHFDSITVALRDGSEVDLPYEGASFFF